MIVGYVILKLQVEITGSGAQMGKMGPRPGQEASLGGQGSEKPGIKVSSMWTQKSVGMIQAGAGKNKGDFNTKNPQGLRETRREGG